MRPLTSQQTRDGLVLRVLQLHVERHKKLPSGSSLIVSSGKVRLDDSGTASVVAKLADFGLTVRRHDANNEEGGMRDRGTPRYMGPEFWDDDLAECIGEAADVYALGCVMWEMGSGGAAFLSDKSDAQVARAKGKASVPMPTGSSQLDKYSAIAQHCRCVNPGDRPRVRDVARELKALCEKLRARLRLP
jgi:serine/threonine protein kinase